jgi:hypothetical protein
MMDEYLSRKTAKISQRFLDGAKTLDEWKSARARPGLLDIVTSSPFTVFLLDLTLTAP